MFRNMTLNKRQCTSECAERQHLHWMQRKFAPDLKNTASPPHPESLDITLPVWGVPSYSSVWGGACQTGLGVCLCKVWQRCYKVSKVNAKLLTGRFRHRVFCGTEELCLKLTLCFYIWWWNTLKVMENHQMWKKNLNLFKMPPSHDALG